MPLLKDTNPELFEQLLIERNGHLDLESLSPRSNKDAWWKCPKNPMHQWEARISGRAVSGYGCPFCSGRRTRREESFAAVHPEIAAEWHPTRNEGVDPWAIAPFSNKRVWWQCKSALKHEWECSVSTRVRHQSGCRLCSNIRTPLHEANPEVARQWHPSKNAPLTPEGVSVGSSKKVWWQCSKDPSHEWQARIDVRVKAKSGCPRCVRLEPVKKYPPLLEFSPELAEQFDEAKNPGLSPSSLSPSSSLSVWWQCPINSTHQWQAIVRNRAILGRGCPWCAPRTSLKTPGTSLEERFPELAEEWHPTKNENLGPADVKPGSSKRVWWRCKIDPSHEWDAVVYNRTSKRSGSACPFCSGFAVTDANSLAQCYPQTAAEWHPTKNGTLTPRDVKRASGKKVWWQCAANPDHEWQSNVKNRTVLGRSCPQCGVENMARRLQEHLLEAALAEKNCHQIFVEGMANLRTLAKTQIDGSSHTKHLFRRMLFSSAITNLETYLSDAFHQSVIRDEKLRIKLLKTSPDLRDRRFDIDDILDWNGRIEEKIGQYLFDIVWHNLAKIRPMFATVLAIQFPQDSSEVHRAVAVRHDIVHRNGRRKDGSVLVIRDSDLMACFDAVSNFVEYIEKQLSNKVALNKSGP